MMQVILSPAKQIQAEGKTRAGNCTLPPFLDEAASLVDKLQTLNRDELGSLLNVNPALAGLSQERYARWHTPFTRDNAKEAIFSFQGEVYKKMQPESFTADELQYAQEHVLLLSGLYGILRPLDLMQPYRLEMGTKLKTERGSNLYAYWGNKLTGFLNSRMEQGSGKILINLASQEYFRALKKDVLRADNIITPVFKDYKNGQYKVVFIYAKQMRGKMTRFIIKNKLRDPERMKMFQEEGYAYDDNLSTGTEWVFTR